MRGFLHPDGGAPQPGAEDHAVTGKVPLDQKAPHLPTPAFGRAMGPWRRLRRPGASSSAATSTHMLGRAPLIVLPYDAELFGMVYEGTQFVEESSARAQTGGTHFGPAGAAAETPSRPLVKQVVEPSASSWGDAGYNGGVSSGQRLDLPPPAPGEKNAWWAWRGASPSGGAGRRRALNQMAANCCSAQSSDWASFMTTGTTVP